MASRDPSMKITSRGTQAGNQRARARIQDEAHRDMNAAQREKIAIEMRMQGYEFEEIAIRCGYVSNGQPNRSAAYKAWRRALRRIPLQHAEEARSNMRLSYNMMRRALLANTQDGKTWAIQAWLQIDERESKLMGWDIPTEKNGGDWQQVIIREYQPGILEAMPPMESTPLLPAQGGGQ